MPPQTRNMTSRKRAKLQPNSPEPFANAVDRLTILPTELLDSIVKIVYDSGPSFVMPKKNLLHVSLVCRRLRDLCVPRLFRRLRVEFGAAGFDKLSGVSSSTHLAPLVYHLVYTVPQFIVPEVENRGIFYRDFYIPHYLSQSDVPLEIAELDDLQQLVAQKYRDQQAFLATGMDRRSLLASVPRLSNLDTFRIIMYGIDDDLVHIPIPGHTITNPRLAARHHLYGCMEALHGARIAGVDVKTFQCEGDILFSDRGAAERYEQILPRTPCAGISNLQLFYRCCDQTWIDSPGLEFLFPEFGLNLPATAENLRSLYLDASGFKPPPDINIFESVCSGMLLPVLQKLTIRCMRVHIMGFEQFLLDSAPNLSILQLNRIQWDSNGVYPAPPNISDTKMNINNILQCLARVGNVVRLKEVNVQEYKWRDLKDRARQIKYNAPLRVAAFEKVLMREISWREAKKLVVWGKNGDPVET